MLSISKDIVGNPFQQPLNLRWPGLTLISFTPVTSFPFYLYLSSMVVYSIYRQAVVVFINAYQLLLTLAVADAVGRVIISI